MLPESFFSFFQAFFLFRKVFPFFRMLPISSLFSSLLPFRKSFLFGFFRTPPSLFSSSFSLSLGLISLSIPFGTFRLLGAFKSGHFSWRDEQVKRERGGDRHACRKRGWSGEKITPAYRHRLPPGQNPGLR